MSETRKPPYGTTVTKPDIGGGVEVGGGDKAAAATQRKAREETDPTKTPPKRDAPEKPKDDG
ncbi:hypothetical protein [Methylopila turkensis]|uniref:Uncharacterized protein n=1 Tax=Methylopila turkensis TaxID=1437816 RepID=A0A9W6JRF2_9HYPH|nr:hypothetical protein [Methylopila turkensis]GLK80419.1 hypothetical protein GCM10008174_21600 [Methylopila turkensis]